MRIRVHTVAGRMPDWVEQGCAEYQRRLPREWHFQWRTVPLARRGKAGSGAADYRERESDQLLRGLAGDEQLVALDVQGELLSTERLADAIGRWQMEACSVALLIGGPDGLSQDCLARAQHRWSLGRVTLPHPLVRIVLVEQLYRAWSLGAGHPYHRA